MEVRKHNDFSDWYKGLNNKEQLQIDSRLLNIERHDHFGDAKDLGDNLVELRWRNGRRVYFTKVIDKQGNVVLLILGGNKNSQKKDIVSAKKTVRGLK